MSETEFKSQQARLSDALARAEAGLAQLAARGDVDKLSELGARCDALEAENAELVEKAERDSAARTDMAAQLARIDGEVQRVRKVSGQLRATLYALRHANAQGVAEPDLINRSMAEELDALRAEQALAAAEAEAIMGTMTSLLGDAQTPSGAPDAPQTQEESA